MNGKTQLFQYLTPIIPFIALAAAIAVVDALNFITSHKSSRGRFIASVARAVVASILIAGVASTYYVDKIYAAKRSRDLEWATCWYGSFFDELRANPTRGPLVVVDNGPYDDGYDPMLKFYADIARSKGLRIRIVRPGTYLTKGTQVATCDPTSLIRLKALNGFVSERSNAWCDLGHVNSNQAQSEHADHADAMVRATKPIFNMTGTTY
jgi:hypothetical protein